jgi:hypothetical protein
MDKVQDTLLVDRKIEERERERERRERERERFAPIEINPEQYAKALHQMKVLIYFSS